MKIKFKTPLLTIAIQGLILNSFAMQQPQQQITTKIETTSSCSSISSSSSSSSSIQEISQDLSKIDIKEIKKISSKSNINDVIEDLRNNFVEKNYNYAAFQANTEIIGNLDTGMRVAVLKELDEQKDLCLQLVGVFMQSAIKEDIKNQLDKVMKNLDDVGRLDLIISLLKWSLEYNLIKINQAVVEILINNSETRELLYEKAKEFEDAIKEGLCLAADNGYLDTIKSTLKLNTEGEILISEEAIQEALTKHAKEYPKIQDALKLSLEKIEPEDEPEDEPEKPGNCIIQ